MNKLSKTIITDKKLLSREYKGRLKTATVLFKKKRVYKDIYGNVSSEVPFEEILTVISKKDKQVWLSCDEVANLKQLLDTASSNSIELISNEVVA